MILPVYALLSVINLIHVQGDVTTVECMLCVTVTDINFFSMLNTSMFTKGARVYISYYFFPNLKVLEKTFPTPRKFSGYYYCFHKFKPTNSRPSSCSLSCLLVSGG